MKPKTIKFILVFFNVVVFSSLGWSQCDGCNPGTTHYMNLDIIESNSTESTSCTQWVSDINDCNSLELNILQTFINNSESTISIEMDTNDDGIINPLELGRQLWVNGR